MRIYELPIEYYDHKLLLFIGNQNGKTIDVYTLNRERANYARLCIQVNLTKPILQMFSIMERHYKVKYEGLHLLCLTCGRFRHYTKGCMENTR